MLRRKLLRQLQQRTERPEVQGFDPAIEETRLEIAQLKLNLRANGAIIEDNPWEVSGAGLESWVAPSEPARRESHQLGVVAPADEAARPISLVVVIISVVGLLLGVATNVATGAIPPAWQPYTWMSWPIALVLAIISVGLLVWQTVRERPSGKAVIYHDSYRQQLIDRVRHLWIKGVLEPSLHGAALMALGLEERPQPVARPWTVNVQHGGGGRQIRTGSPTMSIAC